MPDPFLVGGLALGGIASLGKIIFGGGQRKAGKAIKPVWSQYQTSPFAQQQLGLAQSMFNARMGGAASAEQNIAANTATQVSNINRGATDASQALALQAQAAGQGNEAYNDLAMLESRNKVGMLGNLNNAYGAMINEDEKVYQSKLAKYQMDVAQKQALLSGGAQNMFGGMGDLASLGIYASQLDGDNNPYGLKMKKGWIRP